MKKPDPDKKRLQKLRAAIRNVWQYDPLRKAVITSALRHADIGCYAAFKCPICKQEWPQDMATVDHEPELGSFTIDTIGDWINRCFFGPMRVVCKPCHRKKPRHGKIITR
jgi:hypothetical protein